MISRDLLEDLYHSRKLSMQKIALELQISQSTVKKYMTLHGIDIRSKQDATYLQHNKSFIIKKNMTSKELELFCLAIGIYWGEGNKASPYSVRLGNTDVRMIKVFLKFLTDLCGIKKEDIKLGLQVFNDTDPEDAFNYWIDNLGYHKSYFHPTVSVIAPQGKGSYLNKNMTGVLQVYVNNKRFKEWILLEIDKYAEVAQW